MDYEKLYKEALERAKIWQDHLNECGDKDYADELNYIFPELAELEDEKIRKGIIRNLEYLMNKAEGFVKDELKKRISWLEKQVSPQMVADAYLRGCDDTEKKWLEKQGEQKVSYTTTVETGDGGINALVTKDIEIPFGAKDSELQEVSYYIPKGYYAYIDDDKVIIKKRGKSKFKVGDWIMDKESKEVFYISKNLANTYKIVDIEGNDYHVPHYILEEDYDVWTIQDAKNGDVLYHISDNGIEYIVMTKGINRCNNVDSYFRYNSIDGFAIDIPSVLSAKDDSITPADKKQRDFLFQKMKEAGYAWDEEKRELKKIEQKSQTLWHPADGDYLPEIDREVIALLDNGTVVFAHRPQESWSGQNINTGKIETFYPKRYDKGGWNQPDVKWWLDLNLPNE